MRFISVYDYPAAAQPLYDLLAERAPEVNISHKEMPTWEAHLKFIASRPYESWYLIEVDTVPVGTIYLTNQREVGLFIFKLYRGQGYGGEALAELKRKHPGQLLANVSVNNKDGLSFWQDQGFKPLQQTLLWSPPC
jgi:RimJ/RimL family protein N-acetyltransferase